MSPKRCVRSTDPLTCLSSNQGSESNDTSVANHHGLISRSSAEQLGPLHLQCRARGSAGTSSSSGVILQSATPALLPRIAEPVYQTYLHKLSFWHACGDAFRRLFSTRQRNRKDRTELLANLRALPTSGLSPTGQYNFVHVC
ncbi:hypothetical protein T10_1542 [Trichinella papuae]|uniref:Uncharacterized protein n=1 Tax=Trichinella papuae TaxID=268474 RepID=A0A0V1MPE0_9BILA|nr:hypothetical protein T10_1542 [Trichinella papuae]